MFRFQLFIVPHSLCILGTNTTVKARRCYVNVPNPNVPNANMPNINVPNFDKTSSCRIVCLVDNLMGQQFDGSTI
jgi:hypothetical protein